jgi:membrane peptidoglycan carboxypeptidase
MSDCQARFIIWGCGRTNRDLALDFHLDEIRVPGGVKTGTQQGPLAAADTLETWMIGYTRHAASAVWVGNANNELVRDGPAAGYASAHTTLWLFKGWMAEYHSYLRDVRGTFSTPAGFEELKPANVTWGRFKSPITERGHGGGCSQYVNGWQRNDVTYEDPCQGSYVRLPDFKPDAAQKLARMGVKYIPIPGGAAPPDANVSTTDAGATNGGSQANAGGGNRGGDLGNNRGNSGGQGNAGGSSGNGNSGSQAIQAPAPQPLGLQECIEGCPERPLRLICGPAGWFIDRHSDYANTLGWREGLVMAADTDLDAAVQRICG